MKNEATAFNAFWEIFFSLHAHNDKVLITKEVNDFMRKDKGVIS